MNDALEDNYLVFGDYASPQNLGKIKMAHLQQ